MIMRPQHYGDTRKVNANFAFKEEKTAQETNTWAGEGGRDPCPFRWQEAAELTQPVSGNAT